jgi:hypothetical protein
MPDIGIISICENTCVGQSGWQQVLGPVDWVSHCGFLGRARFKDTAKLRWVFTCIPFSLESSLSGELSFVCPGASRMTSEAMYKYDTLYT